MAGHSKWHNIQNRKGAQDRKKSRDFFIVSKQIRIAVKLYQDGNPDSNPALRLAVEKARAVNMPKENVQRAISRGLGKNETGQQIQEIMYEGYGPHGVGFLVMTATDNVQRTAGELKHIFSHNGGSLSGPGSVSFMFERREGNTYVPTMPLELNEEQLEEVKYLKELIEELDDVEDTFIAVQWPAGFLEAEGE